MRYSILFLLIFCTSWAMSQDEVSMMPRYYTWKSRNIFDDKNTLLWGAAKLAQDTSVRVSWDLNEDGVYEVANQPATKLENGHYYFETAFTFPLMRLYRPNVKVEIQKGGNWQVLAEKMCEVLVCPDSYHPARVRGCILDGLRFLYKSQKSNGGWNSYNSDGGAGLMVLAFENEGFLPQGGFASSPFCDTVKNGLQFLEKQIVKESTGFRTGGYFGYTTPITALAFVGAKDEKYKSTVSGFMDFMVSYQTNAGGWGYNDRSWTDSSISHWAPTAFIYAAEVHGYTIPQSVKDGLFRWLQAVYVDEAGRVAYQPKGTPYYNSRSYGILGGMLFCLHCIQQDFRKAQDNSQVVRMRQMFEGGTKTLHNEWQSFLNEKNAYNYYVVSKGLKTFQPQVHYLETNEQGFKWFASLTKKIIELNQKDGSLGNYCDYFLGTAFNVLTLQPYVLKHRPVAEAGTDIYAVEGRPITLDASDSWHSISGEPIVSYEWDLNGDNRYQDIDVQTGSQTYFYQKTIFTQDKQGNLKEEIIGTKDLFEKLVLPTYFSITPKNRKIVHLRVKDAQGRSGEDTVAVYINKPGERKHDPVIHIPTTGGFLDTELSVSLGNSYDPDPEDQIKSESVVWDQDGDGTLTKGAGLWSVPVKETPIRGRENLTHERWIGVKLESTANETAQKYVLLRFVPNQIHKVEVQPLPSEIKEGDTITVNVAIVDNDNQLYTMDWELWYRSQKIQQARQKKDGREWLPKGSYSWNINFPDNGEFTIKIVVKDNMGKEVVAEKKFQVANVLPKIKVKKVELIDEKTVVLEIQIEDVDSDCQAGFTITWEFEDGNVLDETERLRRVVEFGTVQKSYRYTVTVVDKDKGETKFVGTVSQP